MAEPWPKRTHVEKNFSDTQMVSKTIDLYEEMLTLKSR